jgi:hypothetical protein
MSAIPRKALLAAAVLAAAAGALPADAKETFTTLKENIFLCISPQVYDEAMSRMQALNGQALEAVRKELSERQQCMFVDAEMVDNIMAPFALILQRDGSKVQVQFIVTYRDRVSLLHRMINRYVLVGWTDESNLEPKTVL